MLENKGFLPDVPINQTYYRQKDISGLVKQQRTLEAAKTFFVNASQEDSILVDDAFSGYMNNTNSLILWVSETEKPETRNVPVVSLTQISKFKGNLDWLELNNLAKLPDVKVPHLFSYALAGA